MSTTSVAIAVAEMVWRAGGRTLRIARRAALDARRGLASGPENGPATSLVGLMMGHVAGGSRTQNELVDALRRNGVLHSAGLTDAMRRTDRALFVPPVEGEDRYAEPYENTPVVLDALSKATLSTPHHHCMVGEPLAEAVEAREGGAGPAALDLGCGTGYMAVVLAELLAARTWAQPPPPVAAVDAVPTLLQHAERVCAGRNVSVEAGFAEDGSSFAQHSKRVGRRFDLIHAGFAVPEEGGVLEDVLDLLHPGGRFVGSVLSAGAGAGEAPAQQELVVIDRRSDGALGDREVLLSGVQCQGMLPAAFDERAAARGPAEELADVQTELQAWKDAFQTRHGRAPGRDDMLADAKAAKLFARFAELRRRAWD